MHPVLRLLPTPVMEKCFYAASTPKQLEFVAPGETELYQNLNGNIVLLAPESLTHLKGVDPKRIGKAAVARKFLKDILDKRDEAGLFSWTLCMLPTAELARQAGISYEAYEKQIIRSCFLDRRDPVAQWEQVRRNAVEIKKRLNRLKVEYFHVESPNIDLRVVPGEDRKWIGISGHNIPSFELFLSPDWRGTEGIYYSDQPSFRNGNYVEGVKLTFRKGKVVGIDAKTGKKFVESQVKMDEGACRIGEFSLTDRRFSRIDRFMANTLYDENYGGRYGNCHMALGSAYSDTYSGNPAELTSEKKKALGFNDSALHWDLVNTENKKVTAILTSGKRQVIYQNGQFTF